MSIERLPVEILHRIFDDLDAQSILLSVRPLCRLFRAMVSTYNRNSLTSFSLNIRKYDDRRKKTTLHLLSSILAQSSLRKIALDIKIDRISNISWPLNCRIEHLTINENITFTDLCQILSCSPQLRTFIVKQSLVPTTNNINRTPYFPQLTSLTIEKLDIPIDKLESFLLLVPSLIYLKLTDEECVFDGKNLFR
jgi:hypothetical protein